MYRVKERVLEVLLVHPGGPFWAKKDEGAWSIPKGEPTENEEPFAAATREFEEETGFPIHPPFISLGIVTQKSGKVVHAWAFQGDCNPATIKSNTATIEWPPRSGKIVSIPEIDRASFFPIDEAKIRINSAQVEFLIRLAAALPEGTFTSTNNARPKLVQENLF